MIVEHGIADSNHPHPNLPPSRGKELQASVQIMCAPMWLETGDKKRRLRQAFITIAEHGTADSNHPHPNLPPSRGKELQARCNAPSP